MTGVSNQQQEYVLALHPATRRVAWCAWSWSCICTFHWNVVVSVNPEVKTLHGTQVSRSVGVKELVGD